MVLPDEAAGCTREGDSRFGIARLVIADLASRAIPGLVAGSRAEPAVVIFEKGEFSGARVWFGRLSSASRLELVFAAHAVNAIRMDADTDQTRMVVPALAYNLISMFCAIWLTFTRALTGAQEWSLRDITTRYPDVIATPAFNTPIRVFGRLVPGQDNLQLPDGINVKLLRAAVS